MKITINLTDASTEQKARFQGTALNETLASRRNTVGDDQATIEVQGAKPFGTYTIAAVQISANLEVTRFNIVEKYREQPGMLLGTLQSLTPAQLSQDDADLALVVVTDLLARKAGAHLLDVYKCLRAEPSLVTFADAMRAACIPS
jgi:Ca2+-binding RTX toxin-like protein